MSQLPFYENFVKKDNIYFLVVSIIYQGWEFTLLLFFSKSLILQSNCERFALFAL